MGQLLVRNVDDGLVRKLKLRARVRGVSAEEEHRRILAESLSRDEAGHSSLIDFLLSEEGTVAPGVELDWSRGRSVEDRDTGL